jgi:DNA-binding transcriptional ArsR family regulator
MKEKALPPCVYESLSRIGGLDSLAGSLPDTSDMESCARYFLIFSDENRLMILHALSKCDLCPCILTELTKLSSSQLSYHLGILEKEGLIYQRSERNWRIYSLTDAGQEAVSRLGNRQD